MNHVSKKRRFSIHRKRLETYPDDLSPVPAVLVVHGPGVVDDQRHGALAGTGLLTEGEGVPHVVLQAQPELCVHTLEGEYTILWYIIVTPSV